MPTPDRARPCSPRELGAGLARRSWSELDDGPAAAASIGQVHRGRWADGREVAVKVQYPGAGEALISDLRQLAPAGPDVRRRWCPGIDVKPLVAELQARAAEELDYALEAEAQRAFAEAFRDDPDIVVPDVVAHRRARCWSPSGSRARRRWRR